MQKWWRLGVSALGSFMLSLSVWATDMAQVVFVQGQVQVHRGEQTLPVAEGDSLTVGDVIRTAAEGHVYLKTVDDGFISLRPNSEMRVDVYDYDPAHPEASRIKLTLVQGTMRSVSGKGAQAAKHHYRLNTPIAAIGVRGTDFTTLTTAETTLTSVLQGGVAVAPLSASCTADSFGPCSVGAVDLYANDSKVVQVTAGQVQLLLKNESNNPDTVNAPLPPEDTQAQPSHQSKSSDDTVVLAQTLRQTETLVAPVAAVNAPSMFDWGRWAPLAQLPANTTYSQMLAKGQIVALNQYYFLAQNAPLGRMPEVGIYGFALAQAEAHFIHNNTATPAEVKEAQLTIDFGQRRFNTSLALTSEAYQAKLSATGSVMADGRFGSDRIYDSPVRSPVHLQGSVAGDGATQAAYVFYQQLESGLKVSGATRWAR